MLSNQMSEAALWENTNKLFVIIIIHSCYCKKVKGNIGLWKVYIMHKEE